MNDTELTPWAGRLDPHDPVLKDALTGIRALLPPDWEGPSVLRTPKGLFVATAVRTSGREPRDRIASAPFRSHVTAIADLRLRLRDRFAR